jgi:adenosylcobinamide kinase/adenosylcobinamide-phosphate guanylyltransferase
MVLQAPLTTTTAPAVVLGAAYSGKSELAMRLLAPDRAAIALGTAPANEPAFAARIAALKAGRPAAWDSRDAGHDLAAAVEEAARQAPQVLIDSVSQWLAGLLVGGEAAPADGAPSFTATKAEVVHRLEELLRVLGAFPAVRFAVVSAEVGGGPAPPRPVERLYRELVGQANMRLAQWAKTVLVVHAGVPLMLKGGS